MMARKLYILAIFLVAIAIGVFGFQALHYWIAGSWPTVPVRLVWEALFGPMPDTQWMSLGRIWNWLGDLPIVAAGAALAYASFLASDTLRRR
jgi:hypothetical protein